MKRDIRYGKAAIRAYRAYGGDGPPLFGTEITVEVFGDSFLVAYTVGDNRNVVATDTMKNFVYVALRDYRGSTHEGWCEFVGGRFLDTYPDMEWLRITERDLSFTAHSDQLLSGPGREEHATVEMEIGRDGVRSLGCSLRDQHLVKLTGSAFADFHRDEFTTLPERPDRPLYIYLDALWRYGDRSRHVSPADVGRHLRETFDEFVSMSIQHLLNKMGTRLLDAYPQFDEVSFEAQNRLWDTSATSEEDPRLRVYSDPKPAHGLIGLTLRR